MRLIPKWLRPEPKRIHIVDPHMGERQLEQIMKYVDQTKYRVGDPIESVAYRQGQADLAEFIRKKIIGGR